MPHIIAACSSIRPFTGGVDEFEVDADSVGGMIIALERRFPGLGDHVRRRMAIAIDGEIHQDADGAILTPASEVVLIPRIGGG
jgi:molybdopterin converting factor small subunit